MGTALEHAAAVVEAEYGVPIEVVRVRDCPTSGLEPLLSAAREGMLNAARHSGAPSVSVYLEVRDEDAVVFVRDRGRGFDPAAVGEDRGGIAASIVGRLARNGGAARIHTAPGEGCELELSLPRPAADPARDATRATTETTTTRATSTKRCAAMPDRAPPRVFLVDDHELFLSGVRAELGDAVDVVGAASEVDAAIELIRERVPDVVLVDVHMPDGGGARVIRDVLTTHPSVRFLALSVSDAPVDVIATIRAGARGYVTKTIAPAELRDAIARVADGDAVFSPRLAGFVLDAFAGVAPPAGDPDLDLLTAREHEVLRLIARGYTYKEIARELEISVKTVETHVSSVLRKLQLSTRHQLARWATDRRLV